MVCLILRKSTEYLINKGKQPSNGDGRLLRLFLLYGIRRNTRIEVLEELTLWFQY